MKLSIRIWILGIALALSLATVLTGDSTLRFLAFLSVLVLLGILSYFKSKPGKILITIVFLATIIFIAYNSVETGALVTSVAKDSLIQQHGLQQGEIIKEFNSVKIETKQDYLNEINKLTFTEEKRLDIITNKDIYTLFTNETPQITVGDTPRTNIQTGLDLRGGARALVQPDIPITDQELDDLIAVSRNRFNVYGLSDVNIKGVSDLSNNKFMLVEVAGATPSDLEDLISQQGKFEAKIGNQTVFEGGEKDISDVCRNDASCASITQCLPTQEGYQCRFAFTIYLRESAAQKHADVTSNISLDETGQYLTEDLVLLIDDKEVDTLKISSGLRGQVTTQISIQGSGVGLTQQDALDDARSSMNHLQTVLITGSLPYKLEIVKLDTIFEKLGKDFIYSILIAGLSAVIIVSLIIFIRYRKFKLSLALLLTSFSELFIILGVAAIIKWNLDLPSIAGILATIGTGVDQQIVIIDETEKNKSLSIVARIKRASFIILASYLTLVAAMLPLYWAGAGLFKGFALTTIIGVTSAILITRPAFADIIKRLET